MTVSFLSVLSLTSSQSTGWPQHATASLDRGRLEILKPDDYLLANYSTGTDSDIGLYMIYYREQKEGSALHYLRCIPGGGWSIVDDKVHSIELSDGSRLAVPIE